MPDPVTTALEHLEVAYSALQELLEGPYKLTHTQKLDLLRSQKKILVIQEKTRPLKKKIPPRPPERPFG